MIVLVWMFDILLYSVHLICCYWPLQAANVLKEIHLQLPALLEIKIKERKEGGGASLQSVQ